ncbi:1002_t:CDS:2 [Diversispora eburnea]|uniref:1002_t:CDS:1 n=1 Tax=Diversispora eburnea TaxID=1213867 RepID=A0A9N9AEL5_9GLOM|nr:1002_t:CDS:2 [Diversispora eburnea]
MDEIWLFVGYYQWRGKISYDVKRILESLTEENTDSSNLRNGNVTEVPDAKKEKKENHMPAFPYRYRNFQRIALASGEHFVPKASAFKDEGKKASQFSTDTIDGGEDGLELLQELGLVENDATSISAEKTRQIIMEDRGTSSIAVKIISDNKNKKGATNLVHVNSFSSSRYSSPQIEREQDKIARADEGTINTN